MKFPMTGQEKGDVLLQATALIEMTAWPVLTVYCHLQHKKVFAIVTTLKNKKFDATTFVTSHVNYQIYFTEKFLYLFSLYAIRMCNYFGTIHVYCTLP